MLQGVLGAGGTGTVYAGKHHLTNRKVAVKLLHSWVAQNNPLAAKRFVREAQAAAEIGHSAIPEVLDAGQDEDGSSFLVFEWLNGHTLEYALQRGEIDPASVIDIMITVLDALEAVHAAGIVHRDVKPDNIFIVSEPRGVSARLLDFGVARFEAPASGITTDGSLIGTVQYMSPEQARGERATGRSDLYAIAATLFRAFAGRPPFVGGKQLELLHQVANRPPPSLGSFCPGVPDLVAAVDRGLRPQPEERFASAAEMIAALKACARERIATSTLPKAVSEAIVDSDFDAERPTVAAPMPTPVPAPHTLVEEAPPYAPKTQTLVLVSILAAVLLAISAAYTLLPSSSAVVIEHEVEALRMEPPPPAPPAPVTTATVPPSEPTEPVEEQMEPEAVEPPAKSPARRKKKRRRGPRKRKKKRQQIDEVLLEKI